MFATRQAAGRQLGEALSSSRNALEPFCVDLMEAELAQTTTQAPLRGDEVFTSSRELDPLARQPLTEVSLPAALRKRFHKSGA